jgi:hypothetical protein
VRGPGEVDAAVVGADGTERTHKRPGERDLVSIFGRVTVSRMGYGARGFESLYPRDAELNLPDERYSHGVRRRAAEEAAKTSFDETVKTLERTTGAHVPKRQTEGIVRRAATDFDAFYQTRAVADPTVAENTGPIMVLTADGKGVVMLTKDLRELTRKKAEANTHKMWGRLSSGEKKNSKRMATVAAVYTIEPFVRRPEDIIQPLGWPRIVEAESKRPRPESKRVWASVEKEPKDVIEEAFAEAARRDPLRTKIWTALVDGNQKQIELIQHAARRYGVKVIIVLDVIHVAEYLWDAAFALHGDANPWAERWVHDRLLEILRGKSSDVAAGMRRSATLQKLPADKRGPVDDCADYLINHRLYLHYDEYLAAGLPIATGVIEGACRHLINDRLDITGARWGLTGAEAVLRLRSLRSSGDFDEYWRFHEAQERQRNHAARYLAGKIPATRHPIPVANTRSRRHLCLVK